MNKIINDLVCPKCRIHAEMVVKPGKYSFLLYTCPRCLSNVVYYKNKLSVISDRLVTKLIRQRKIRTCGTIDVKKELSGRKNDRKAITEEDIKNLKILLETEPDIDKIISKI
jgi:hypothetical protein